MTNIQNLDNWNMNKVGLDTEEHTKWRVMIRR